MDDRRRDLLNRLEAAADKTSHELDDDFLPLCFQILYGLPTELQLRAALHMGERYAPIYEKKVPGASWVRQLLGDLDAWFRTEREVTPDGPDDIDSADQLYRSQFTSLLVGYHHRDDPTSLTAGVCAMMLGVIHARARRSPSPLVAR